MKHLLLSFFLLNVCYLSAQDKIGVVDSQRVLDTIPSRKARLVEIEIIRELAIKELTAMDSEIQELYVDYFNYHGCINPIVKVEKEKSIADFQREMQSREQEIDSLVTAKSRELTERSQETTKKAVELVSARLQLNFVFDKTSTLYVNETFDITNLVIQEVLKIDSETK